MNLLVACHVTPTKHFSIMFVCWTRGVCSKRSFCYSESLKPNSFSIDIAISVYKSRVLQYFTTKNSGSAILSQQCNEIWKSNITQNKRCYLSDNNTENNKTSDSAHKKTLVDIPFICCAVIFNVIKSMLLYEDGSFIKYP